MFALGLLLALAATSAQAKPAKLRDIYDTVAANPIMTQFAAVIAASGQGTFLSSKGPFTLFVPTDAAFAKLPPGTLAALLRPENQVRLQDILLYHLVNGKRYTAKDLLTTKTLLSCQGSPQTIHVTHSGAQLVDKAKIVHADITCRNGIIHEIDTLLMPPESAIPPLVAEPPPAPADTQTVPTTNAPGDTNAPPLATPVTDTNAPMIFPSVPPSTQPSQ